MANETKLVYNVDAKAFGTRQHHFETPNAAEALEQMLKCWLLLGFHEVTIKREWRKVENDGS